MSDDEHDVDIESDEGEETADSSDSRSFRPIVSSNQYLSQAAKRAHHNALERKRRDHIKDSFSSLRDSVPSLLHEKVVSRAQILKKAAEYILYMKKKNGVHQQDIDDLKRQNSLLDTQIRQLEKAKVSGNLSSGAGGDSASDEPPPLSTPKVEGTPGYHHVSGSDTSDSEYTRGLRRNKKLKVATTNGIH